MSCLNLRLLGGFEAEWSSGTSVSLPTRKARALLAYCALQPSQLHQRDTLATLLWGDTEDAKARNSLRQTLFVLRAALGEAWAATLCVKEDAIAMQPSGMDVDVLRFERLASDETPPALEQAAALYRGDLLQGFVVDEEPFEQWLFRERERLRDLALEVLAKLLRRQDTLGMTALGIQTARRLLALDPLQEAVHRVLMRLYAQSGRREAAIRQYEVCVGLLRRELRLEPEPDTQRLYERIVSGTWYAPGATALFIPDRDAEETEEAGGADATEGERRASNGAGSQAEDAQRGRPISSVAPSSSAKVQSRLHRARIAQDKARGLMRKVAQGQALLPSAVRRTAETVVDFKEAVEGGGRDGSSSPEASPTCEDSGAGSR